MIGIVHGPRRHGEESGPGTTLRSAEQGGGLMYRLRTPLPWETGESLIGLVARNADKYHFRNPRLLLARANPPPLVPWSVQS